MSKLTLNETVTQHVTCGRCGAAYDYDQTATAEVDEATYSGNVLTSAEQRARGHAKLNRIFDRGLVVPCPRCKALTPAMQQRRLRVVLQDLIFVGIGLIIAWGVMVAAVASGGLAWGLGIIGLLSALGYTLKLLSLPFGGYNDATGRLAGEPAPAGSGDVFGSLRMPGGPGD